MNIGGFQAIGSVFSWILSHPVWTGIGAIAGVAALLLAGWNSDSDPLPPPPCDIFLSDFTAASPENEDFARVLDRFDVESARTVSACDGRIVQPALEKLAKHYSEQRAIFLRSLKENISDGRTATNGSSGTAKRYDLRAECRGGMIVEAGSFSKDGYGGCYGDAPQANATFIAGVVSQTGRGKSACTVSARCVLAPDVLQTTISNEMKIFEQRIADG